MLAPINQQKKYFGYYRRCYVGTIKMNRVTIYGKAGYNSLIETLVCIDASKKQLTMFSFCKQKPHIEEMIMKSYPKDLVADIGL